MKLLQGLGFDDGREPVIGIYGRESYLVQHAKVTGWQANYCDATLPTVVVECKKCEARLVVRRCMTIGRASCDHGEWADVFDAATLN